MRRYGYPALQAGLGNLLGLWPVIGQFEAYYGGIPEGIRKNTVEILDERLTKTVNEFRARFMDI